MLYTSVQITKCVLYTKCSDNQVCSVIVYSFVCLVVSSGHRETSEELERCEVSEDTKM